MRRFFIDPPDAEAGSAYLSVSDSRHIRTVLRLKPGAVVILFDGTGHEYTARVKDIAKDRVSVLIIDRRDGPLTPPVKITIAQAFLKEKKMDLLLRSLTEIGIDRWIPFFAERSVAKPETRGLNHRSARWEKIVRESMKQCRRNRAPEVCAAGTYEEAIHLGESSDLRIAFWEKAVDPVPASLAKSQSPPKEIFLLMGPEGGFSEKEMALAVSAGFVTVSLGPRILRAETASLVACSLIQYIFGDLGGKNCYPE